MTDGHAKSGNPELPDKRDSESATRKVTYAYDDYSNRSGEY